MVSAINLFQHTGHLSQPAQAIRAVQAASELVGGAGDLDARIAPIALTHRAAVWTWHTTDDAQVPGRTVVQAETGTRVPYLHGPPAARTLWTA